MIFRTEIELHKSTLDISYKTPTMFVGSCFSDNIGAFFQKLKLPVFINPFGVLYNPASICMALNKVN
ncbi:MAG: GSCFA domain-containing protein [Bacteroidales bacterium]|nr:GSCFA domain-containing protein [Bacteroidales bacterium]